MIGEYRKRTNNHQEVLINSNSSTLSSLLNRAFTSQPCIHSSTLHSLLNLEFTPQPCTHSSTLHSLLTNNNNTTQHNTPTNHQSIPIHSESSHQLLKTLKDVNQMIQKAARLRCGPSKAQVHAQHPFCSPPGAGSHGYGSQFILSHPPIPVQLYFFLCLELNLSFNPLPRW